MDNEYVRRYQSEKYTMYYDEPIIIDDNSLVPETRKLWYSYVVLPR